MNKNDVKYFYLDNGLRVILLRNPSAPFIVVNSVFHAGSKNENEFHTGISHMLEHLMFTSLQGLPSGEFDRILSNYGGESNASTTCDFTSYIITVPSSALELALWLDSKKYLGFSVSNKDFDIQKSVVLEEKKQIKDNLPYGRAEDFSSKFLFPDNGYKWSIIGEDKDIENMKLQDVEKFYYNYYSPSNAILTLVGDFQYFEALHLIKKYYSHLESRIAPKYVHLSSGRVNSGIYSFEENAFLEGFFMFFRVPGLNNKIWKIFKLLEKLFYPGESSVLFKELFLEREIVNELNVYYSGMEYEGVFHINCILNETYNSLDAENKINETIDAFCKGHFCVSDIKKAVNCLLTEYYLKLRSNFFLAEYLPAAHLLMGDYKLIFEGYEDLGNLSVEEIAITASSFFKDDYKVILNFKPAGVTQV